MVFDENGVKYMEEKGIEPQNKRYFGMLMMDKLAKSDHGYRYRSAGKRFYVGYSIKG